MLLATATTPSTPMFIMPGVMKKAPPLPMKPLSVPPMKPSKITCKAVARLMSMYLRARSSGMVFSDVETFHSMRSRRRASWVTLP
jgi:hypothetical protein